MAISLAASKRALCNPAPIDISDPDLVPDVEIRVPVGVNLTLLGATHTDIPGEDPQASFAQRVNMPLLVSSVSAAYQGSIDAITLDCDFHVQPWATRQSAPLDGVTTAGKLAHVGKTPRLCAQVPSDPTYIREAVALLTSSRVKEAAVMITLQDMPDFHEFQRAADDARAAGVQMWLLARNPDFTAAHAHMVARMFDVVRVRMADSAKVRQMRFALREQAAKLRREIDVYVEIGIVISASLQAAEERALLLSELNGTELFHNMASVVGTVYDVADAVESWVGMGAADGVIFTPASLPTDLASVLKGVLPLLQARALLEEAEC